MTQPTTPEALRFFTDEHIAAAIVDQLRQHGVEVLRCEDVGMKGAADTALLEYATEHGYALLSMDDDVTRLHHQWTEEGRQHTGIFYAAMDEFQGQAGIGPIVRHCSEWATLIAQGVGTLAGDIHNRIEFIKK